MKVNRVWREGNFLVELEMDDGSRKMYRKYEDNNCLEQIKVCPCCYFLRSSKCEYFEEEIRDAVVEAINDFNSKNSQ